MLRMSLVGYFKPWRKQVTTYFYDSNKQNYLNSLVVVFTMVTHHLILILIFDYFESIVMVIALDMENYYQPHIFKIFPFMYAVK
jgi:hypothetical protein